MKTQVRQIDPLNSMIPRGFNIGWALTIDTWEDIRTQHKASTTLFHKRVDQFWRERNATRFTIFCVPKNGYPICQIEIIPLEIEDLSTPSACCQSKKDNRIKITTPTYHTCF